MRKVFLDDLPHKQYGNSSRIDWKHSVGYTVKFIYDDIKGKIKINNYNSHQEVTIKYLNRIYIINCYCLMTCQLGVAIGLKSNSFKYGIGDVIETNTGKIQIIKQIHIHCEHDNNRRGYEYVCLIDNYVGKIVERDLLNGRGCSVCGGKQILIGINDIWTTASDTARLLLHPEDGYKYSKGSHCHLDWKCPDCGNIVKNKEIKSVNIRGLCCPVCSDGISYPEKFMYNLLKQLNVDFGYHISHRKYQWCKGHDFDIEYDFEISSLNCIIETHGLQHYEEMRIKGCHTLQKEQNNDIFKEQLAKDNGIENYIVIDCRKSDMEWIKNSILHSSLVKLFDLSNIDWIEIARKSNKNIVKEVCEAWQSGIKDTNLLHIMFKLDITCIRNYLHKGNQLGWCDYHPIHSKAYILKHQDKKEKVIK